MKIAMVFDGLDVGGVGKVGINYSDILLSHGHQLTIINLNPKKNAMQTNFNDKCKFINFHLSQLVVPEKYEQLIKQKWWGKYICPFIYVILRIAIFFFKLIFTLKYKSLRYDAVVAFSGHFNDLSFICNDFLKGRKKICWLHGALYQYALISNGYLALYNKIKNLVVLVDDVQDDVLAYNSFLNLNITKIYNPIPDQKFISSDEKVKLLQEKYGKFILMVARFSYPHKDQYTVINAFKKLIIDNKEDLSLLFVGDGPELSKVKLYIKNLPSKVQDNIYFVGNKKDVADYYQAAYLLVHSSVFGEGLPTVILEAMVNGCPVVATDSKVGPKEIIGDNKYGLLCPVKDPVKMADCIEKLCKDDKLYEYYCNMGKKRVIDFSPSAIYIKIMKVLNRD